jgi:outer membrane protein assembly factor BamB
MRYLFVIAVLFGFLLIGCGGDDATGPDEEEPTPDVDFTYTPDSPVVGEEVTFNGETNEGSSDITSWEWNFGDPDQTTASGQTVTFTYENADSYNVELTASDNNENSVQVDKSLTIASDEFQASIAWSIDSGNIVPRENDASSPAIADDGTVYYVEGFANEDSRLFAVSDNGDNAQIDWETIVGDRLRLAPSIGPDGDIYISTWTENGINKIEAETGNILWSEYTVNGVSNNTTAVDPEGNVYFGTQEGPETGFYSFGPNGTERWSILDNGDHYASPALSNDGNTVYFRETEHSFLYAVSTEDGTEKWDAPVDVSGGYGTSVSVDSDGTVYLTTGSEVIAVSDNGSDGSVKWTQSVDGSNQSGVVIGPEGNLYVGSEEGLVSLNPDDGSINWIYDEIAIQESVPAVDSNGNVYVGSVDGRFHIVDSSGELLREFSLGDDMVTSPAIADDGTVYIEASESVDSDFTIRLYKITVEDSSGPADSNWPMKGKNRKNTSH